MDAQCHSTCAIDIDIGFGGIRLHVFLHFIWIDSFCVVEWLAFVAVDITSQC